MRESAKNFAITKHFAASTNPTVNRVSDTKTPRYGNLAKLISRHQIALFAPAARAKQQEEIDARLLCSL